MTRLESHARHPRKSGPTALPPVGGGFRSTPTEHGPRPGRRRGGARRPRPHPFASPAPALAAALDTTDTGRAGDGNHPQGRGGRAHPLASGDDAGPVPSPELARALVAPPAVQDRARRPSSAFRVAGARAHRRAAAALDLLDALCGQANPPGEPAAETSLAVPGGSLRYFCAVGALAATWPASAGCCPPSCARLPQRAGRVAGTVRRRRDADAIPLGTRWEARWRPVLTGRTRSGRATSRSPCRRCAGLPPPRASHPRWC